MWDWFTSSDVTNEEQGKIKDSLLKGTYRFDKESDPQIFAAAEDSLEKLGVSGKVYIYQAQNSYQSNATLLDLNGEYHIVFSGQLLNILSEDEKKAIIGHELGHALFDHIENGEFAVVDRILHAVVENELSEEAYEQTARHFSLYREIYCDKAAYKVVEDLDIAVSALVKTTTGLTKVSAKNYLKQASEIFDKSEGTKSEGVSHPELFVRVKALELLEKEPDKAEEKIRELIEEQEKISDMNVLMRFEFINFIEKMIRLIMMPDWIRTDQHLSLAQNYFPDINLTGSTKITESLIKEVAKLNKSQIKFLAYLLMDFAFADNDVKEVALGHSFRIAEGLEFQKVFEDTIKKELNLTPKSFKDTYTQASGALNEVLESGSESIYEE